MNRKSALPIPEAILQLQRQLEQFRSTRPKLPEPPEPLWQADALAGAHHVLEMFRRALPDGPTRKCLDRLSNRLTKIATVVKSLGSS